MSDQLLLRPGAILRVLKTDPDIKDYTISKKSAEFLNHAVCLFARTLTQSVAANAARAGKGGKREKLDESDLHAILNGKNYLQLGFLKGSLPAGLITDVIEPEMID